MTTSDWIDLGGVLIATFSGMYALIMTGVDRKIGIAIGKMRDEQIRELKDENHRKEEHIERLKERMKDMK